MHCTQSTLPNNNNNANILKVNKLGIHKCIEGELNSLDKFSARSLFPMPVTCAYRCCTEIECGVPAQCLTTSRLVAQTGRSFLDLAIFQCDTDATPAVMGSVCQLDGTWSHAMPRCVQQAQFITPQHPFDPPSRQ